jgi:WD40 repeat protein
MEQIGRYLSSLHHISAQGEDDVLLITGQGRVFLCPTHAPQQLRELPIKLTPLQPVAVIPPKNDALLAFSSSAENQTNLIEVWNLLQPSPLFTLEQTSPVDHLFAFTYNDKRYLFASCMCEPIFKIWTLDPPTQQPLLVCDTKKMMTSFDICFIQQKPHLVGLGSNAMIKIWEFPTGQLKTEIPLKNSHAMSAAIAVQLDDHPLFIIGSRSGAIEIWDLESKKLLKTYHRLKRPICYLQSFCIGRKTFLMISTYGFQTQLNDNNNLMILDLSSMLAPSSLAAKIFKPFYSKK